MYIAMGKIITTNAISTLCLCSHTHPLTIQCVSGLYHLSMCIAMGKIITTNAISTLCRCSHTYPLTIQCVSGLYHLPMWYVYSNGQIFYFQRYIHFGSLSTNTPSHYTMCEWSLSLTYVTCVWTDIPSHFTMWEWSLSPTYVACVSVRTHPLTIQRVSGLYHLWYYTPTMGVLLLHSTYEWLLSSVCTLTHESYTFLLVPRRTRRWWPLCVFVHRHTLSLYNVWVVFITYLCDMGIAMGKIITTNAISTLCLCSLTYLLTMQWASSHA